VDSTLNRLNALIYKASLESILNDIGILQNGAIKVPSFVEKNASLSVLMGFWVRKFP
jgi:hypothetical protein